MYKRKVFFVLVKSTCANVIFVKHFWIFITYIWHHNQVISLSIHHNSCIASSIFFFLRIASSILYMSCKDLCNIKVYYPCCIYRWYTEAMHVLIYVFVLAKFLSQIFARSFSLRESLLIEKSEGGAIPNWPCINSIYFHCATLFP